MLFLLSTIGNVSALDARASDAGSYTVPGEFQRLVVHPELLLQVFAMILLPELLWMSPVTLKPKSPLGCRGCLALRLHLHFQIKLNQIKFIEQQRARGASYRLLKH